MKIENNTRQRQRAEVIQQDYRNALERVKADRDLSDDGRQRQIASLYKGAMAKLREQHESEQTDLRNRWTDLERQLFGNRTSSTDGGATIAARDAADRAAKMASPEDAERLLYQAEQNGDDLLARAVARECIARTDTVARKQDAVPWEGVFRTFLDARPALVPLVQELETIENLNAPALFSPFSVPRPAGVSAQAINMADTSPEPPERTTSGPLRNPATTSTTAAERADWDAAVKAEAVAS